MYNKNIHQWIWLVSFLHLVKKCGGQTGDDARNLYSDLFTTSNYNKYIRPTQNLTEPTFAYLDLVITGILELDEVSQKLTTVGYMDIIWWDEYLAWTPSNYGGLEDLEVPQTVIWKPDIHLQNGFEDFKELGGSFMSVRLLYDGLIIWQPYKVFQTKCSFDIKYFPFDRQDCSIDFVVWTSYVEEVEVLMGADGIILENFESNGEWKIAGTSVETKKGVKESVVSFSMKIERKPLAYMIKIIIPVILLGFLNTLTFILPVDSGEKMSYSITVFLSFAVFLTIVSSSLPNDSDSVSYLNVYLIFQLSAGVMVIIVSVFQLRFHHRKPTRKVPKWCQCIVKFTLILQCRRSCRKRNKTIQVAPVVDKNDMNLKTMVNDINDDEDKNDNDDITWQDFVAALDFIFFWVLFIVVTTVTVLICLLAANPL